MVHGFLNVNKQKQKTSYDIIRELKNISGMKKLGHAGTLDPLAEGVLVVALNEATKMIEFMKNDDKEYIAEIILGKKSSTYDAQGDIEIVSDDVPDKDKIIFVLKKFVGEIDQIPPKFSAVKIKGRRAYSLARKGEQFELKSRKVFIKSIDLIDYDYPLLKINIICGSGTYIRSLADDIGKELAVGAYVQTLLRTRAGDFSIENSLKVSDIFKKGLKNCIIPIEKLSYNMSEVEIDSNELKALDHGRFINRKDIDSGSKLFTARFENKIVGVLEKVGGGAENLLKYKRKLNVI